MKLKRNPFKMWGSWVGAISYPIIGVLYFMLAMSSSILQSVAPIILFPLYILSGLHTNTGQSVPGDFSGVGGGLFMLLVAFTISGFLIGWGIHIFLIKRGIVKK